MTLGRKLFLWPLEMAQFLYEENVLSENHLVLQELSALVGTFGGCWPEEKVPFNYPPKAHAANNYQLDKNTISLHVAASFAQTHDYHSGEKAGRLFRGHLSSVALNAGDPSLVNHIAPTPRTQRRYKPRRPGTTGLRRDNIQIRRKLALKQSTAGDASIVFRSEATRRDGVIVKSTVAAEHVAFDGILISEQMKSTYNQTKAEWEIKHPGGAISEQDCKVST